MGYVKIWDSINKGDLAKPENRDARQTLIELLIQADRHGVIDKTAERICSDCGLSLEVFERGMNYLSQESRESTSPEKKGRRVVLLAPRRKPWGWRIVNFEKYRTMVSESDRSEYQHRYYEQKTKPARKALQIKGPADPQGYGVALARAGAPTVVNNRQQPPRQAEAEAQAEAKTPRDCISSSTGEIAKLPRKKFTFKMRGGVETSIGLDRLPGLEALYPSLDVPFELGVLEIELRENPSKRLPPASLERQIRRRLDVRQAATAEESRGVPPEVREKLAQLSMSKTANGCQ